MKILAESRLITGDRYRVGTREVIPVIRRTALTCCHSAMVSAVPVAVCIREQDRAYLYLLEEHPQRTGDTGEIEDILAAIRMD